MWRGRAAVFGGGRHLGLIVWLGWGKAVCGDRGVGHECEDAETKKSESYDHEHECQSPERLRQGCNGGWRDLLDGQVALAVTISQPPRGLASETARCIIIGQQRHRVKKWRWRQRHKLPLWARLAGRKAEPPLNSRMICIERLGMQKKGIRCGFCCPFQGFPSHRIRWGMYAPSVASKVFESR